MHNRPRETDFHLSARLLSLFSQKQMITPTGRSISVGEQDCRGGAQVGTHLSTTRESQP